MGNIFAKKRKVLMIGIDYAGRTSLLYTHVKPDFNSICIPTIGFNVEDVKIGNKTLEIWDVGGGDKLREMFHVYYPHTDAVIFVIDSTDNLTFRAKEVDFHLKSISKSFVDRPILILAHKQDIPNCMRAKDLVREYKMDELFQNRKWNIMETTIKNKSTLENAFKWMADNLN